ncbi:helix-turn-helix domain-containing protein [Aquamicrobium sp. LC103]|nr:helix-turn-helix domain-containing protein [Aquamicrobium sp. LC103]
MTETASLDIPLIVSFGAPYEIALGRAPSSDERFGSFSAGLYGGPVHIRSPGTTHCLQVNFTPPGARRFFRFPLSELADRMVPLDDLADRDLLRLSDRLGEEADWETRFDIAEDFLETRLRTAPLACAATGRAYARIVASGGRVTMARIAEEAGWSRKHLAGRFREEIGCAPKAVARIVRFNRAQALASGGRERGWADIAAAAGYADQAHLVREFSELAGATPAAWLSAFR